MKNRCFFLIVIFFFGLLQGQPAAVSSSTINVADYADIQKAISALPPTGGTIWIPAGVYEVSEPLVIAQSDVTLRGAGSGTIIKNNSSSGANTIELRGRSSKERIWRVEVTGMRLTGNGRSGHGVFAKSVNELSLHDLWVDHHAGSGLYLDDCYENPRVFDNNITYNQQHGIYLNGCHDIIVSANQLEENGYGIFAEDVWNAGVTGNSVDDHLHYSLYFRHVLGSIISANMFENSVEKCLVLDEESKGITVSGNIMRYSGKKLLHIIKATGITVTGNTFEADQGTGLEIEQASLITVGANVFFGAREDLPERPGIEFGIRIQGSSDITITGNTIVKPLAGGLYVSGSDNRYISISHNTIKNPSAKYPGKHCGILLEGLRFGEVTGNTIVDESPRPNMRAAIQEGTASDHNLIRGNRVTEGTNGTILVSGEYTKKDENYILPEVRRE